MFLEVMNPKLGKGEIETRRRRDSGRSQRLARAVQYRPPASRLSHAAAHPLQTFTDGLTVTRGEIHPRRHRDVRRSSAKYN